MARKHEKSIFVFRRDLRLDDNSALLEAVEESDRVLACFILDPRQTEEHPYRSAPAIDFMLNSLNELQAELEARNARLHFFKGRPEEIIGNLCRTHGFQAVYMNRDYTPFSVERDSAIRSACNECACELKISNDSLLCEPEHCVKPDGTPYVMFTPFWKKASVKNIASPRAFRDGTFLCRIREESAAAFPEELRSGACKSPFRQGGRREALGFLETLDCLRSDSDSRDYPARTGTTGLSAHLKFGTVSIREVYHAIKNRLGAASSFLRQLYWRDFFTHIAWHFPHVFQGAFHKKYDALEWAQDEAAFERWCEGSTGFPIVDAGMHQLNETGYMHNRARMITASFLVKDLHINWQLGERYFARRLIDYDPSLNNGNWQWCASTGCDAQPYFRIFNPWLQQKKFDPDCEYIKRWIPELRASAPEEIHSLESKRPSGLPYPEAMVDHAEAGAESRSMFEEVVDE